MLYICNTNLCTLVSHSQTVVKLLCVHRYRIQQGLETETRTKTCPYMCLALRNGCAITMALAVIGLHCYHCYSLMASGIVCSFISEFCDEAEESTQMELVEGSMLPMETIQWMLLTNLSKT